jgi:thioredoxin reductase (NADPH)
MEEYDFLIIGAGGAGLASAMYSARLGLKTLVLGKSSGSELPIGGVITTTDNVENYPGFIKLTGTELAENIEKHARSYDLVTVKEERVTKVAREDSDFKVETENESYKAKAILFATGTKVKKLDIPGSTEFENKGVNYCALCDSPLFRDKIVGLIGGSDSAAKDALVLSEHAKKVYVIYRKEKIRAEPINLRRVESRENIEVINNTNITEIRGDTLVKSVELDKPYNGSSSLDLDGVFVAIGHIILSDLAKELGVNTNEKGEVVTDKMARTNVERVYAAGDVADNAFKQLITGVAEGCTAAYSAYQDIAKDGDN